MPGCGVLDTALRASLQSFTPAGSRLSWPQLETFSAEWWSKFNVRFVFKRLPLWPRCGRRQQKDGEGGEKAGDDIDRFSDRLCLAVLIVSLLISVFVTVLLHPHYSLCVCVCVIFKLLCKGSWQNHSVTSMNLWFVTKLHSPAHVSVCVFRCVLSIKKKQKQNESEQNSWAWRETGWNRGNTEF